MSKTVAKTMALLEVLAAREKPCSLADLAQQLGAPKSNVHFLLSTLAAMGYVEQEPETRRYFLTLKIWELGTRVSARLELIRVASPFLASLADSTSETVNLAVLDHDEVLYVEKIDSPLPVRAYHPLGYRAPPYCTSTGKALLAFQSPETISRVAKTIVRHTEQTVSNAAALDKELAEVRRLGYSTNRGEWDRTVRGVAVPIRGSDGRVLAAVGVFGPVERLSAKRLSQITLDVLDAGALISKALGYNFTDVSFSQHAQKHVQPNQSRPRNRRAAASRGTSR